MLKPKTFSPLVVVFIAVFSLCSIAQAQLNPGAGFFDFFERATGLLLDNQPSEYPNAWIVDGAMTAQIISGVGAGSSNGLRLETEVGNSGKLLLDRDGFWQGINWVDLSARLAPKALEPTNIDSSACSVFYLTAGGGLRLLDGNEWVDFETGLDVNAMHRYTVRQDFSNQSWKLWLNGSLLTPQPLAFANSNQTSPGLCLESEGDAISELDNIRLLQTAPEGLSDLADFNTWSATINWQGNDSSVTGDPNQNGVPNLLEYAIGTADPVAGPSPGLSPGINQLPVSDNNRVTFSFIRRSNADDVALVPYISYDLINWQAVLVEPSAVAVSPLPTSSVSDVVTISVTVPQNTDRAFLRLSVEESGS